MKTDASTAAKRAVEVAAREIERLAKKTELEGWDGANLQRYADICIRADDHELKWMAKLDPASLPDELVRRVLAATEEGEADGAQRAKRKRTTA